MLEERTEFFLQFAFPRSMAATEEAIEFNKPRHPGARETLMLVLCREKS
jgi:hypothetical protein